MNLKFALGGFALWLVLSIPGALCAEDATTLRQPIFLMCPHNEHYSAWSLALVVDKNTPSKPLKIILEKLNGKNGKDDGYAKVYAAQRDAKTEREELASLDAKSFGSGALRVEKDNALKVTVTPEGENFNLMIDMRISAEGHFIIGGAESTRRNVILKYNKIFKTWEALATVLADKDGSNVIASPEGAPITGIDFKVTATGIFTIAAVLAGGNAIMVYDK